MKKNGPQHRELQAKSILIEPSLSFFLFFYSSYGPISEESRCNLFKIARSVITSLVYCFSGLLFWLLLSVVQPRHFGLKTCPIGYVHFFFIFFLPKLSGVTGKIPDQFSIHPFSNPLIFTRVASVLEPIPARLC